MTAPSRMLIAAAIVAVFPGCSATGFMSPIHPYDFVYDMSTAVERDALKEKIKKDIDVIDKKTTDYYATKPDDEITRRLLREQIVGTLMNYIDEFWRRYRSAFYGDTAALKSTFEITAGALSGASAITTPASAAKILAALSSGVTASSSSLQKNLLEDNATDLILAQMEADRQAIGFRIRTGLVSSTMDYPLAAATHDVADYASAMSVPSALASLRSLAGKSLQQTKDEITETNNKLLRIQQVGVVKVAPHAAQKNKKTGRH